VKETIQEANMNLAQRMRLVACLGIGILPAMPAGAQDFGFSKERVTLVRKLPGLVHLAGTTIKVKVTGHEGQSDLARNLQALLETEFLKDDSRLRVSETSPSAVVTCQIISYSHPKPTITTRPGLATGKTAAKSQDYMRVTGSLNLSFQAKSANGQMLGSDNVTAKYDEEFDSSGNTASQGVLGTMSSAWKRVTGGASSESLNPPTDDELQSRLMADAVRQIAIHIVNTREPVEVFLAKKLGAIDAGDKQAQAGLWQRALETFETAPPLAKLSDDAYRLYNIGVAYEALAYQAEDEATAMKYLDEAAINYGKAIDAKPAEKYFLQPQMRIETAIAHYRKLEAQENEKTPPAAARNGSVSTKAGAPPSALTNAKVIAMVKSGVDDDTVAQTIRVSKAVSFDLSAAGRQSLTDGGVSAHVLTAMKSRAAQKPAAAK
jgi:tetratricopeptide (TPR) repeat protein